MSHRRAARRSSLDSSHPSADGTGQAAKISLDGTESLYHSKVHGPPCGISRKMPGVSSAAARVATALLRLCVEGLMLRRRVQVASAAQLPRQTGNMYTASLWAGLASLISELGDELLACQVTVCCKLIQGTAEPLCMYKVAASAQGTSQQTLI